MISRWAYGTALWLAFFVHAPLLQAQLSFSTIALSGSSPPGTSPDIIYQDLAVPTFSPTGSAAFLATISGSGVTQDNNVGLWAYADGQVSLLAREGSAAPGVGDGAVFADLPYHPGSGPNGFAFYGRLAGASVVPENDTGIWAGLSLVAREGDAAPGIPMGGRFGTFAVNTPPLNAFDQTAFAATVAGDGVTSGNNEGIWMGTAGSLQLLAREGEQATGFAPGISYSSLGTNVRLNASGRVAFTASVAGPPVSPANDSAVWFGSGMPGGLSVIAREGAAAPGVGATFTSFSTPLAINHSEGIAFRATLSDGNNGVWTGNESTLSKLALRGEPAPGAPGTFRAFDQVRLDASGRVTFFAEFLPSQITSGVTGIWAGTPGAVSLLFRTGDPFVPGGDTRFSSFDGATLAVNSLGMTMVAATISGPGITPSNDYGLWLIDASRQVSPILREGDVLEVAPGDSRTVATFLVRGGQTGEGLAGSLNDRRQAAFHATFTDGSEGVFIAQIPEPTTMILLTAALAAISFRRGTKRRDT